MFCFRQLLEREGKTAGGKNKWCQEHSVSKQCNLTIGGVVNLVVAENICRKLMNRMVINIQKKILRCLNTPIGRIESVRLSP